MKAALTAAAASYAREEEALQSLFGRSAALGPALSGASRMGPAAPLLAGLYLEALARRRATREQRLAVSRADVERLRRELTEASRERAALEMLRERRRAEFERARELAEERELDELNTMLRRPP